MRMTCVPFVSQGFSQEETWLPSDTSYPATDSKKGQDKVFTTMFLYKEEVAHPIVHSTLSFLFLPSLLFFLLFYCTCAVKTSRVLFLPALSLLFFWFTLHPSFTQSTNGISVFLFFHKGNNRPSVTSFARPLDGDVCIWMFLNWWKKQQRGKILIYPFHSFLLVQ